MLDALAEAMRIGVTAWYWYLGTSAVAVGSVIAGVALGRRRG